MKAMILAAGLGQRMRPLTDHTPKPLLTAGGKPLIEYHLEALAAANVKEVVINLAYLGDKIRTHIDDGTRWNLRISYSQETEPLETGGGILKAMPLLGDEPFLLINGDVWTDYPIQLLRNHCLQAYQRAHLILVPNPEFHPTGDFASTETGLLVADSHLPKHTFAGISLIDPRIISQYPNQRDKFPLGEVLRYNIEQAKVTGEVYKGRWSDVGTPERLHLLNEQLTMNNTHN